MPNAPIGSRRTIGAAEAAACPGQQARLESLVRVAPGERITERDALEGLLIASGDNLAEILARWDDRAVSLIKKPWSKVATWQLRACRSPLDRAPPGQQNPCDSHIRPGIHCDSHTRREASAVGPLAGLAVRGNDVRPPPAGFAQFIREAVSDG